MAYMYGSPYKNGYTYNNLYSQHSPYTQGNNSEGNINKHLRVKKPSITLEGTGKVKVVPDIAVVILGVITEGTELSAVQQENAEKIQSVIHALARVGVDSKDIETESYSILPQYDFIEGRQVFKGYRVTNTLKTTLSNTEEVGRVIDAAVASGANIVNDVRFVVSNPTRYYKIALSNAIEDAVNKARSIERKLDIVVDKTPIDILEISPGRDVVGERREFVASAVSTPIIAGETEIVARIKAIFNFRKN